VVDCGSLGEPDNGRVMVSDTIFNAVATYSCEDGYALEGHATRICLADGSWSGKWELVW
jgi:hypothetical protein